MSRRLVGGWLITRVVGVLMLSGTIPYWSNGFGRINGDVQLYAVWSNYLLHGLLPYKDFGLMYPPGVLPFFAMPHSSTNMYIAEFVALAVLADLGCLLLLARSGQHHMGAIAWVVGVPLLGPVAWGRLDIFVAFALLVALTAVEARRPLLAGAFLGFAGLVKLWPFVLVILLMPLLPGWRRRIGLVASATATAIASLLPLYLLGAGSGLRLILTFETHRGVEVESLPAVPLHIARALGAPWLVDQSFGSLDLATSGAGIVKTVSTLLMAAATLSLMALVARDRGRRFTPAQVALLLVVALLVFSRVLSPQYLLWLLAAVALCLDHAADRARLAAWTGLALVATQAVFPFKFADVTFGGSMGVLVVVLHALVILALAGVVVREVFSERSPSGGHRHSTQDSPGAEPRPARPLAELSTVLRMRPADLRGSSL